MSHGPISLKESVGGMAKGAGLAPDGMMESRLAAEPLTGRELEVLRLAGTGLSQKAIAQALGIGPGTVKWHLTNSYQKLGAGCRDDALKRAREQRLLQPVVVCPACSCKLAVGELTGVAWEKSH